MVHPCLSRIFPCGFDDLRVDVVALDVGFDVGCHQVAGLLHRIAPVALRHQVRPPLGQKGTTHARRHVGRKHGSLDGEGAAAAEGIHQDALGLPGRQRNQRTRQGLGDGRLGGEPSISALVQGFSGRVQGKHRLVLHEKHPNRVGLAVLLEPVHMVMRLHPLHNRLFDDGLDIRGRKKLALDCRGLCDPEFCIDGEEVLPGHGLHALEELVVGRGMDTAHLQQNALRGAQKDVCHGDGLGIAPEGDAAVLHGGNLIAQIQNFSL